MTEARSAFCTRSAIALLFLLALPFDPHWIDFEHARRGALLLLVGAIALLKPSTLQPRAHGDAWLLGLVAWTAGASAIALGSITNVDAWLRILWLLALLMLWRLGATADKGKLALCAAIVLIAVSLVGVLQRLGVPLWIGSTDEPVSLFGNRNVAAEFVAIAGACVAAGLRQRPRWQLAALALAGVYAMANGSRSGIVALPLGVGVACALSRELGRGRWMPLLASVLGMLSGALWLAIPAPSAQPLPRAAMPGSAVRTETLQVRAEIHKGGLAMLLDAPILGHGAGQFAVDYPRYRTQREIELSSMQRAEMRRVASAHDDWMETAIEGGLAALAFLLLFFWSRLRPARIDAFAAPMLALAALMLIRSPLGNAPAVALALLFASKATLKETLPDVIRPESTARWQRLALRILGCAMLLAGVCVLTTAFCLARFAQQQPATADTVRWLERAVAAQPADPVALQLLASERARTALLRNDAERGLATADALVAIRPFEPSYRLLRADLMRMCGKTKDSKRELAEASRLDPFEPQVQIQLAGVYATEGDYDAAIVALATDPPVALRNALAEQLDALARAATEAQVPASAARIEAEAAFVRVLDAMKDQTPRGDLLAKSRLDAMREKFATARIDANDMRPLALLAALSMRTGQTGIADTTADLAKKRGAQLPAWQWSLLREVSEPLRSCAGWAELLPFDAQ